MYKIRREKRRPQTLRERRFKGQKRTIFEFPPFLDLSPLSGRLLSVLHLFRFFSLRGTYFNPYPSSYPCEFSIIRNGIDLYIVYTVSLTLITDFFYDHGTTKMSAIFMSHSIGPPNSNFILVVYTFESFKRDELSRVTGIPKFFYVENCEMWYQIG